MKHLSLDDFEWEEEGFDRWYLNHKQRHMSIALIQNFNGWHVKVLYDASHKTPIHVDSLDAAKALVGIIATPYMEKYYEQASFAPIRSRIKKDGPPKFRAGVFKVD